MKALVGSGGGSWGAIGAGTLHRLDEEYDTSYGVSTGNLFGPFALMRKWEELYEAYTELNQSTIFNANPFTEQGNLNLRAYFRAATLQRTLGETKNLKEHIKKYLTPSIYDELRGSNKHSITAVQNLSLSPNTIEYKDSDIETYSDFIEWMWAAANPPIIASILEKDGYQYTDAGLTELLSLSKAILDGHQEIDVIVHRPKPLGTSKLKDINNLVQHIWRLLTLTRSDVVNEDIYNGIELARSSQIKLRLIWLKEKPRTPSMIFNKEQMVEWWDEGFNTATSMDRIQEFDFKL